MASTTRRPLTGMSVRAASAGQGSIVWTARFQATALPAWAAMVSRRSTYSVHAAAVQASAAASAKRCAVMSVLGGNGDLPAQVEDVAGRGHHEAAPRGLAERDLLLAREEEIGVARRQGVVERRAQLLAGLRRLHEARRHDDGESVSFFSKAAERKRAPMIGTPSQGSCCCVSIVTVCRSP